MKISTLCFPMKEGEILLAMKKRGFGVGLWNGSGGKVNAGESIPQAALRELQEEVGLIGAEEYLEPMGILRFRSANEAINWDTNLFRLHKWEGEPQETEEMRPQWYPHAEIPFGEMWPDDKFWFPYLLAGKKIEGIFEFDITGKEVLKFEIKEIG